MLRSPLAPSQKVRGCQGRSFRKPSRLREGVGFKYELCLLSVMRPWELSLSFPRLSFITWKWRKLHKSEELSLKSTKLSNILKASPFSQRLAHSACSSNVRCFCYLIQLPIENTEDQRGTGLAQIHRLRLMAKYGRHTNVIATMTIHFPLPLC